MAHLSDMEFADYLDGALTPSRDGHLTGCEACRAHAESLRQAMVTMMAEADVPEPSPLFWEHFSQRVRDAIDEVDAAAGESTRWFRSPIFKWTVVATAVSLVVGATLWVGPRTLRPTPPSSSDVAEHAPLLVPADLPIDLDADQDWALVRIVAEELEWEDAHEAGIAARPGSADRVALEMSPAERQEFARLLEDEMKRTGA